MNAVAIVDDGGGGSESDIAEGVDGTESIVDGNDRKDRDYDVIIKAIIFMLTTLWSPGSTCKASAQSSAKDTFFGCLFK